jgi:endonuclease/exonuclease/phosphatase family metal-dependent hydrolase
VSSEVRTLSVLQFNTWLLALPFLDWSTDYRERRRILPDALAAIDADVISLQEVWVNRDKESLERALRPFGYGYFVHTHHRFGLGDGMFLASKFPLKRIERSKTFRTITRFIEYFGAKRVVAATVDHPDVGEIDLYQTHLGSIVFDKKTLAYNAASRRRLLVQLLEVAEFIGAHRRGKFAVLTGDLNFHYQVHEGPKGYGSRYADEYTRFLDALKATGQPFENSFLVANGLDSAHPAVPTYSQENPYAKKEFDTNPEETLDYVLFAPHGDWKPVESRVVFRERVSQAIPALSDHYGIRTVFEFKSPN